jgi:hypothetical protein
MPERPSRPDDRGFGFARATSSQDDNAHGAMLIRLEATSQTE